MDIVEILAYAGLLLGAVFFGYTMRLASYHPYDETIYPKTDSKN